MASGNTLLVFSPLGAEFPVSNFATLDTRNNHPCLDFDASTGETVYFSGVMPRNYAGGGITVSVHSAATSATSGTIGWLIALERGNTDLDADSFAADQTITAAAVNGTSGIITVGSVAITDGANMDSIAAGEYFRLRVTRDVANDSATGDAELYAVEIKET